MAESNNTSTRLQALTARNIEHLADRLFSRGTSILANEAPTFAGDLRTASRVMRKLLCEVDRLAAIAGDRSRTIPNLTVTVEG